MYVSRQSLVVPHHHVLEGHVLAATTGDHQKIQAYSGTKAIKNYGITVQGSGVTGQGEVSGSLVTYDYKALYDVYNLKQSDHRKYWFVSYSKDTSHDELKKTFEKSKTLTTNYDFKFTIQGNDYGVNSVFITLEVIRLEMDGVTKDFVVNNSSSLGANNADGSAYQGEFKAVDG
ncbi:MAG: hypothetical protein AAF515_06570 [Pseudomonadota bacterium]